MKRTSFKFIIFEKFLHDNSHLFYSGLFSLITKMILQFNKQVSVHLKGFFSGIKATQAMDLT